MSFVSPEAASCIVAYKAAKTEDKLKIVVTSKGQDDDHTHRAV